MRALTLWRPWHFAFLYLAEDPKRVENRPWRPWPHAIGKRIALHAGKHYDAEAARLIGCEDDPRGRLQGIVGTAVVKGWIHYTDDFAYSNTISLDEAQRAAASRWFFGPYGWLLDDVRVLDEPIPCSGALGLWHVPHAIELELLESPP